ncbi:MAG: hypothetical protein M3137_08000, partial [Actinomycetota bacterium]|nr:hypothetical protein [Actinomycetota bacterium]
MSELEAGAEEDEVGYRLDDWADDARGRMIVELVDAGIAHRFENDELVVDVADEERVDALVGRLTNAAVDDGPVIAVDDDALDGSGSTEDSGMVDDSPMAEDAQPPWGGAPAEVAQLEAAAARLSVDPTDMEADGEVAEASTAVFMVDDPPWADPATWAAVGRVTRRLMAALGADDAQEAEIRNQAGILSSLLQAIVGPRVAPSQATEGNDAAPTEDAGNDWTAAGLVDANNADAGPAGVDGDDGGRPGGPTRSVKRTETIYELGEWLPEQRAELAMLLDREHIAHLWDSENLVVASESEADVEMVLDRIEA